MSDEAKLRFVAFTFRRLESKARMVYPVQPVGVSRCCCIASRWVVRGTIVAMPIHIFKKALFSNSSQVRGSATESPSEKYRVRGIVRLARPTYADAHGMVPQCAHLSSRSWSNCTGSCFSPYPWAIRR